MRTLSFDFRLFSILPPAMRGSWDYASERVEVWDPVERSMLEIAVASGLIRSIAMAQDT